MGEMRMELSDAGVDSKGQPKVRVTITVEADGSREFNILKNIEGIGGVRSWADSDGETLTVTFE